MTVAKDQLLGIMRARFDYYSARAVFEKALLESNLEDKDSYREAEVARLVEALGSIESRMDRVVERIAALVGDAGPAEPEPKPVAKPTPSVTITLAGFPGGGEALVCGGCPALGNWEPGDAAAMTRDGDLWKLALDLDPGSTLELKFLRRDPEGQITWEAGENRVLEIGDEGGMTLDAEWHKS